MAPIEKTGSDIWWKGKSPLGQIVLPKSSPGDPCRVLEPSRKKLESLEAQRIMAVLEETVRRVEILAVLSQVMKELPRFSVILGADLVTILEKHQCLQKEFQEKMKLLKKAEKKAKKKATKTSADKDATNRDDPEKDSIQQDENESAYVECSERDALNIEVAVLGQQIVYSLREIFRYFAKNPKATEVAVGAFRTPGRIFKTGRKMELNPVHRRFVDAMNDLREIMRERLLTSPHEKKEQKKYIKDVIAREKKTNVTMEKLQMGYGEALKDKEDEISRHDEVIARLENELSLLEKMTYEQQRRNVAESMKQCSVDTKASETRRTAYNDEIIQLKKKLRNARLEHRDTEKALRKRAFKMATEVYNWVQKFDADMDSKQDEFDIVQRLYDEEKQDLAELERQLEILQKKFDAIMEERRLAAEKEAREEEERKLMEIAATKMQALWRGYRVRKLLKGKAKKAGKKGKGK